MAMSGRGDEDDGSGDTPPPPPPPRNNNDHTNDVAVTMTTHRVTMGAR